MTQIKSQKFILSFFILFLVIPVLVNAQPPKIIPDCGTNQECGYDKLIELVNNIITWIIWIAVPISAGVFAWAGLIMMLNADNPGKRKDSIDMMKKVFWGLVFILAAWIIVTTITNALIKPNF